MANHKSAKTRINRNNKRAVINGARRSRVRTFVKKVDALINAKEKDKALTSEQDKDTEAAPAWHLLPAGVAFVYDKEFKI